MSDTFKGFTHTAYKFRGFTMPAYMLARLHAYEERGEGVGDFLTAVLENNLKEAVGQADEENLRNLPVYVGYLYNTADSRCWGSPEKVREWYRLKAMESMAAESDDDHDHDYDHEPDSTSRNDAGEYCGENIRSI